MSVKEGTPSQKSLELETITELSEDMDSRISQAERVTAAGMAASPRADINVQVFSRSSRSGSGSSRNSSLGRPPVLIQHISRVRY